MTREQRRAILAETVKAFARKEWFRDAAVYDAHPVDGQPTLEIKCNYVPIFERKDVMEFATKFNLAGRFLIVDKNGNPAQ